MDFFDKLGKKASETYKGAAEKTGKIAKETKLKMAINENKSKINDIYKEIGAKVYEKHIREEEINIDNKLTEDCMKIDVLADEIEDYRKEILELKDRKQCKKCSKEMDVEFNYCPNCGEKQDEDIILKQTEETSDTIENEQLEHDGLIEEQINE